MSSTASPDTTDATSAGAAAAGNACQKRCRVSRARTRPLLPAPGPGAGELRAREPERPCSLAPRAPGPPRLRRALPRVFALSLLLATSPLPAHAEPPAAAQPDTARARRAVDRGELLFQAHNYDAALAEFWTAYRLLAADDRQYLVLNNIAVCHERMFRYDLALRFYERYLEEGGPRARDRAVIERVLGTLRGLLGQLTVSVNVPAELWVDARHLGRAPGTFLIPAGKHVVELRASMHESSRHELQLNAGAEERLTVTLERLSRFRGLQPGFFWTSVALTGVAAAVAAGYGASALHLHAAAEQRAQDDRLLNTQADEAQIRRHALIADLGYAGLALFGATSVVLYLLTDWDEPAEQNRDSLQLHAAASASATGAQLGLWGSY